MPGLFQTSAASFSGSCFCVPGGLMIPDRSNRRTLLAAGLLLATLFASLAIPSAAQVKSGPMGSMFTPAHWPNPSNQDVLQAILEIGAIGNHASYMWQWADGQASLQQMQALTPLFRQYGLKVFLQLSPTGLGAPAPPNQLPATFTDPQTQAQYLSDVKQLALLQPDYINLGAEINLMYYLQPAEFKAFEPLYQQAYALVKQVSPSTQVGVSYHLDLFFGDSEFNLIDELGPQDYIGFTTYPAWTVYDGYYSAPNEMETVYYDRIRSVIPTTPIVFSEVGWPTGGLGSMADQAAYVSALPKYMAVTKPALITWTMEHDAANFNVAALSAEQIQILQNFDVNPQELFNELDTMGILSNAGPPKPAWVTAETLSFGVNP